MFKKIEVNGENAEPLFEYLKNSCPGLFSKSIKWNFTKFLVDSKGRVVDRFAPSTKPEKLEDKIKVLIKEIK